MIFDLVEARRGHFLLESGLHSALWLDLDPLFADQRRIAPFVSALAAKLPQVDVVCGALVGGAFLAQLLAQVLGVEFIYSEQRKSRPLAALGATPVDDVVPTAAQRPRDLLFQTRYELPSGFHSRVRGKRVAIVDDVMSAGSALRGTYSALRALDANVVVAGALLELGDKGADYFAAESVPVVSCARDAFSTWAPIDCPLCRSAVPLQRPADAG